MREGTAVCTQCGPVTRSPPSDRIRASDIRGTKVLSGGLLSWGTEWPAWPLLPDDLESPQRAIL